MPVPTQLNGFGQQYQRPPGTGEGNRRARFKSLRKWSDFAGEWVGERLGERGVCGDTSDVDQANGSLPDRSPSLRKMGDTGIEPVTPTVSR